MQKMAAHTKRYIYENKITKSGKIWVKHLIYQRLIYRQAWKRNYKLYIHKSVAERYNYMNKKLKIMYNNELIATIDEGQKATICCNNKKMEGDLILSIIGEALSAPTISLEGDILTMTATDDNTEQFVIFVDGMEKATVINRYHDGGDAG